MSLATVSPAASTFDVLSSVNVNDHTEKKNGFTYLSWPFAFAELERKFPGAEFISHENEHGVNYWVDPRVKGGFVKVEVVVNGKSRKLQHPVLDNRNKPILEPTGFDINTSIFRAFVKCIGLHGLGLYIYAGEDLPDAISQDDAPPPVKTTTVAARNNAPPAPRRKGFRIAELCNELAQKPEYRDWTPVGMLRRATAKEWTEDQFRAACNSDDDRIGNTIKALEELLAASQ